MFNRLAVRPVLYIGFAALFLVGCAGSKSRLKVGASGDGEVVEAEGLAPNIPTDLLGTKRSSLMDAQRNAVEKVVGVFVSARTLVEKAVAIENNILSRTEGWVKKFDVVSEGVDGEFYKTKIRALVAMRDLEAALKDMSLLNTPPINRPRVLITLTEQVEKEYVDDQAATRSLERGLQDRGFVVVTKEREKEAELIIEGKAAAFPFQSEGLGGFVSYRARLTLQVRRPGTKDILLSVSKEASGLGGNKDLAGLKALEVVGEVAAEDVANKVAEEWNKGKNVLVFVEGVKSFTEVDRIRKHLSSQPGVNDLTLRLYDEGTAQFEVQLGSIQPAELASQLETSKTLKLKVLESSPQSIRLQFE